MSTTGTAQDTAETVQLRQAAGRTPHDSYRHEAFLYRGDEEFLGATTSFVRDGVRLGQPVMVAVIAPRLERLRDALGPDAAGVEFVDMARLGGNPARIIPGWRRFVDEHSGPGRPVRGVGEPVWAGRRADEVAECQLHEALLNLAVEPDTPLWLRCPYDVKALDPEVVQAAFHSHPALAEADSYRGSTSYGGAYHAEGLFAGALSERPSYAEHLDFACADLLAVRAVRAQVTRRALASGLDDDRASDLTLAVAEVATNSVRHGGGRGALTVWQDGDMLTCEVADAGCIDDPLAGRRMPAVTAVDGRGLWLANQLCDLVQVRSGPRGTTVRLISWL